jgi:hypothetical protein
MIVVQLLVEKIRHILYSLLVIRRLRMCHCLSLCLGYQLLAAVMYQFLVLLLNVYFVCFLKVFDETEFWYCVAEMKKLEGLFIAANGSSFQTR